jgi:peptide/nickel transport system permease protein
VLVYTIRKLLTGAVVFVSVTALTFFLLFARGGYEIARSFLSDTATPEQINARAEQLGLLRPIPAQYWDWLVELVTGASLGRSYLTNAPVVDVLMNRSPVTISLLVVSLVLTIAMGIPLGVVAATRGGLVDRGLQIFSVTVQAIPNYGLGLILVLVFALGLHLLPATGFVPLSRGFGPWLATIILPSLAIALGSIAFVGAQIRGAMLDLMRQDFVRTLRSRGVSRRSTVFKHALRSAAPPTLTILSLQVIQIVGGSVIVERIYALPGLGSIALSAGNSGDLPVVLGVVAWIVVIIVAVNLIVDVLNGFLNPKARVR